MYCAMVFKEWLNNAAEKELNERLAKIKKHLNSDEEILADCWGQRCPEGGHKSGFGGIFVATSKCVNLWQETHHLFSAPGEYWVSIPYEDIRNLESGQNHGHGWISIVATNKTYKVGAADLEKVAKLKAVIQEQQSLVQKANDRKVTSDDIPAQIQKLASLKDAGILTEEEFATKKAELLAKM